MDLQNVKCICICLKHSYHNVEKELINKVKYNTKMNKQECKI